MGNHISISQNQQNLLAPKSDVFDKNTTANEINFYESLKDTDLINVHVAKIMELDNANSSIVSSQAAFASFLVKYKIPQFFDTIYEKHCIKQQFSKRASNARKLTPGVVFCILIIIHSVGNGVVYKGKSLLDTYTLGILLSAYGKDIHIPEIKGSLASYGDPIKKTIAAYTAERLFSDLRDHLGQINARFIDQISVDMTSLTIFCNEKDGLIKINFGYSRDKSSSSPQCIAFAAYRGDDVYDFSVHDGNTADFKQFKRYLTENGKSFKAKGINFFTSDAASCKGEMFLIAESLGITLITRLANNTRLAKLVSSKALETPFSEWKNINEDPDASEILCHVVPNQTFRGHAVNAYVLRSEQTIKMSTNKLTKKFEKDCKNANQELAHLKKNGAFCEKDLIDRLQVISKHHKYVTFKSAAENVVVREVKDADNKKVQKYFIHEEAVFEVNKALIEKKANSEGFYILISSGYDDVVLDASEIVARYNRNQKIEQFWKRIKDPRLGACAVNDSKTEHIYATVTLRAVATTLLLRFERMLRENLENNLTAKSIIYQNVPELACNKKNLITARAFFDYLEQNKINVLDVSHCEIGRTKLELFMCILGECSKYLVLDSLLEYISKMRAYLNALMRRKKESDVQYNGICSPLTSYDFYRSF